MATSTLTDLNADRSVVMVSWTLTTADPTGDMLAWSDWADRTVLCESAAAWGTATFGLEGSNNGTVWVPLSDIQGTAISKTTDSIENVVELCRFVRPRLTTPGTGASVNVSIVMRKGK
jgi:hypothetical protein